jgi:hypothetical protein
VVIEPSKPFMETRQGSADDAAPSRDRGLLEDLGPLMFRSNAFRVTGLAVDVTPREVSRHHEKLRVMERLGSADTQVNGAIALDPPPDADAIREAVQRLQDPERRLLDEFFWFWPREFGHSAEDPALAALAAGNVAAAADTWMREEKDGDAVVAPHNLAVLSHMLVLDYEHAAPGARLVGMDEQRRGEQWEYALDRWKRLVAEERFWDRVAERIAELDDPRVTGETARRLRAELPLGLLAINAQLAVRAAERREVGESERQLALMGRWEPSLVERTILRAVGPLRERLQLACDTARAAVAADARGGDAAAERLLEQTQSLLEALDRLLSPSHPVRVAACDAVADTAMSVALASTRTKPRWAVVCGVLERALAIAASPAARERLAGSLEFAQENRDQEWCWFCTTAPPDDPSAVAVPMYGDVTRVAERRGTRLEWRPFVVQVPRCRVCRDAHAEIDSRGVIGGALAFLFGMVFGVMVVGADVQPIVFVAVPLALVAAALGALLGRRQAHARVPAVKPLKAKNDFPQVGRLAARGWSLGTRPPRKAAQER